MSKNTVKCTYMVRVAHDFYRVCWFELSHISSWRMTGYEIDTYGLASHMRAVITKSKEIYNSTRTE
jgi:hypothetical protein